ncbi:MAG: MarR family transcriptional regulator [Bacteroidota bacterium]|nr:MarR family transcriptional regulator [Bacteroidota bacterium]
MRSIEEAIQQSRSFRNPYHKATVNLIYSGRWIINMHNELFNDFGLTIQQYNVLRILKGQYPRALTVKLIQLRMLDKASDASRVVEGLRKKGLVQRELNSEDRRRVDVIITQKGIQLLSSIEKRSEEMDRFLSNLDKEEIKVLNNLLDKIRS